MTFSRSLNYGTIPGRTGRHYWWPTLRGGPTIQWDKSTESEDRHSVHSFGYLFRNGSESFHTESQWRGTGFVLQGNKVSRTIPSSPVPQTGNHRSFRANNILIGHKELWSDSKFQSLKTLWVSITSGGQPCRVLERLTDNHCSKFPVINDGDLPS